MNMSESLWMWGTACEYACWCCQCWPGDICQLKRCWEDWHDFREIKPGILGELLVASCFTQKVKWEGQCCSNKHPYDSVCWTGCVFYTSEDSSKKSSVCLFIWESLIPRCVRPQLQLVSVSPCPGQQHHSFHTEWGTAVFDVCSSVKISVIIPAVLCMWNHCDQLDGKIDQLMH